MLCLMAACHLTPEAVAQINSNATADALFRDAVALADKGKFELAIPRFQASYELDPAHGTLLGWAMAEEGARRLAQALSRYHELLDVAQRSGDMRRARVAKERIASLEPRVPKILIVAQEVPTGAKFSIDGQPLPAGVVGTLLPVDPGEHTLRASTPGSWTFEELITAKEFKTVRVDLAWDKFRVTSTHSSPKDTPDSSPPTALTSLQLAGLAVGGAGVLAAGLGTYWYVDAGSDFDDVESSCNNNTCPPSAAGPIESGRRKENMGRISLILGGIMAATGATLFVIGREEKPHIAATVRPGGVSVGGKF